RQKAASSLTLQQCPIEHIGSTAIPNQRAKPVIDIFIGVSPFAELPFISAFLMQRSITTLRQI
ncbi:TPA: GrpB family protein, partial [Escherichia coli]|nr:GrpB family protein [Escherichia coli]